MESMTNRDLAKLLIELTGRLNVAGDSVADATAIETARRLEQVIESSTQHSCDSGVVAKAKEATSAPKTLSECVERIKQSTSLGHPLSERFSREVKERDRARCVGSIAFEDLWNGYGGWKSPEVLWDMVIYVWRNAPDLFDTQYDSEREIIEDSSAWTQGYFDDQRNYLRHNFCLKRLCHLVMVYEYLHGAKAVPQRTISAAPYDGRSPRTGTRQHPPLGQSPLRRFGGLVGVMIIAIVTAYLIGAKSCDNCPAASSSQQGNCCTKAERFDENQPFKTEQTNTGTMSSLHTQGDGGDRKAVSNDIVSTTFVLQDPMLDTGKAPVHRPGEISGKK